MVKICVCTLVVVLGLDAKTRGWVYHTHTYCLKYVIKVQIQLYMEVPSIIPLVNLRSFYIIEDMCHLH